MRRIISIVATSIAALAFITSCQTTDPEGNGTDNGNGNNNGGGTEPPVETVDPVEEVSGTYNGVLNIDLSLMGSPATNVSENLTNEIVISAADAENTVDIQVKALSVSVAGMDLDFGDRTFEACTVTDNDGSYSISGEAQMSAEVPEIFKTPVECDVTVAGTVTDGALTLTLTVSVAELPAVWTPADKIVGTYDGLLNVSLFGSPVVTDEPKSIDILLSETSEGAVNLRLEDLTLSIMGSEMSLGTIMLTDLAVTETEGVCSFKTDSAQTITVENLGECSVEVDGTVTDGKVSTNLTIKYSMLTVTVTFEGTVVTE